MGMIAIDQAQLDRIERQLAEIAARLDGATVHPAPEWLPIPMAARAKGVTTATVRRWITEGRIEARGSGRLREVRLD